MSTSCDKQFQRELKALARSLPGTFSRVKSCAKCCRRMCVSLLHAVLPRDGVAVLRVMQEGHVDSDERRSVSGEDLTSDYRHQAATDRANTRGKKGVRQTRNADRCQHTQQTWFLVPAATLARVHLICCPRVSIIVYCKIKGIFQTF